MVSYIGAKDCPSLVTRIDALNAAIANVQGAIKGQATVWKMSADVYVNQQSQSLMLQYDIPAGDSANILKAVLVALQNQLNSANVTLAAIS